MPFRTRRLLAAVACTALLAALGGCGRSDEERVRDTVGHFAMARNDADYQKLCDLFDQSLRQDQGLVTNCAQTLASQSAGQPPPGKARIVSVKVKGGQATAELDVSQGSAAPSRLTITLVRRDGEWKIASTT